MLILFVITVLRINRATPLAVAALLAAVLTVVFFVAAIVSGGFVSTDRLAPKLARALHWVMPFLTFACTVAALMFLR